MPAAQRLVFAPLLLFGLTACQRPAEPQRAPVAPTLPNQELRDRARLVLEQHCGACHISHYPTAIPGALAVFDLAQEEWAARMTPSQLEDAAHRLTLGRAPGGNDGAPLSVDPEDVRAVRAYVDSLTPPSP